jgi:hypothetical protein
MQLVEGAEGRKIGGRDAPKAHAREIGGEIHLVDARPSIESLGDLPNRGRRIGVEQPNGRISLRESLLRLGSGGVGNTAAEGDEVEVAGVECGGRGLRMHRAADLIAECVEFVRHRFQHGLGLAKHQDAPSGSAGSVVENDGHAAALP